MRVEFTYDKRTDATTIYVWAGATIVDKYEMPGVLSGYSKRKIKTDLLNKQKE